MPPILGFSKKIFGNQQDVTNSLREKGKRSETLGAAVLMPFMVAGGEEMKVGGGGVDRIYVPNSEGILSHWIGRVVEGKEQCNDLWNKSSASSIAVPAPLNKHYVYVPLSFFTPPSLM